MIYLDYNATTPLAPEAREAMRPFLEEHYGNPSSIHAPGRIARAAIDDARDRLASLLRVKPHELIFTGGGTESDNLAVLGLARKHARRGQHLITCTTEHHAVLHAFEHLQKHEGFRVTWLPVDGTGRINPDDLAQSITPETILVSLMCANNETGTLQPLEAVLEICRERGVLVHTDAVQSFGKLPLDLSQQTFDAVSLAAHKFQGPKGAGLLFLRAGTAIQRLQFGGFHENERRPGTENPAAIAGMAVAAELATGDLAAEQEREGELSASLWEGIASAFPAARRNGNEEFSLANTVNVSFPGLDGESLLMNLDLEGVCASTGSACMVGSMMASHVLVAMGVPPEVAKSSVRFSLGRGTTKAEIDEVIAALPNIVARLQPEFAL